MDNKVKEFDKSEMWLPVIGYEKYYKISNKGRLRRILKKSSLKYGNVLKPAKSRCGYYLAVMSVNGKCKSFSVHRLVAKAFIPNPENKPQVNHIDGVKANNFVENLEWNTASENVLHAFRTGLEKPLQGVKHPMSKLTDKDVLKIRELLKTMTTTAVGKIYGMNRNSMLNIKKGHTWSHI